MIEDILKSKSKPKEKQLQLVEAVCNDKINDEEFIDFFTSASDVDKGTCADAMKHISKLKPEVFAPFIDTLVDYIDYKASRVKWDVPETIGNMTKKCPDKVEKAIPKLLRNTKDESTIVRWCAAYALSEIARYNQKRQKELISIFFWDCKKREK